MNSTLTQYETFNDRLTAVLDAAPSQSWDNPSPCEGWSARDVLRHLVDTQRDFLTTHGADLGDPVDLDADPAAAWRDHAKRVTEAVADDRLPATEYDGHFGRTTVGETLVNFYVFDMMVHRWDIGRAVGVETRLSEAELDTVEAGADSFGEALYMDGVCRPGVTAPPGADRQARLLARLGREA